MVGRGVSVGRLGFVVARLHLDLVVEIIPDISIDDCVRRC